jgi:hypothetical protein
MSRVRVDCARRDPPRTLWTLGSPAPHDVTATCTVGVTSRGFETSLAGLGATLRCGYHSRDAAEAAATRLCDQLLQRGWIRRDGTVPERNRN